MGIDQQVGDTTKTFITILGLGLVGLLFLIIFGNLSGNLGFTDDSNPATATNETLAWLNTSGYTLDVVNSSTGGYVITAIWGNTPEQEHTYNFSIPIANATVSNVGVVTNTTVVFNATIFDNVSLSYTYSFATTSQGEADTNEVIGNLTGGAVTFFGFSNVWFVLLAITLLIIIVISVIAIVSKGGKSSFSS